MATLSTWISASSFGASSSTSSYASSSTANHIINSIELRNKLMRKAFLPWPSSRLSLQFLMIAKKTAARCNQQLGFREVAYVYRQAQRRIRIGPSLFIPALCVGPRPICNDRPIPYLHCTSKHRVRGHSPPTRISSFNSLSTNSNPYDDDSRLLLHRSFPTPTSPIPASSAPHRLGRSCRNSHCQFFNSRELRGVHLRSNSVSLLMGTGASKNSDTGPHGVDDREDGLDQDGGQLHVSLKMENYKRKWDLIPHVYGSVPLVGSWDADKALPMERESASIWELSFVVPPNHETLDFKFLLKPKDSNALCVIEDGPNRLLTRGALQGDARMAIFKLNSNDDGGNMEVLEYRVVIKADKVSPFDLAASWRAYQENLQPSTVRGIPDVSINAVPDPNENGSSASLELDIEHYVVPAPAGSANSGLVYAANLTENPRVFTHGGVFSNMDGPGGTPYAYRDAGTGTNARLKEMEVVVPELPTVFSGFGMVESKSAGTFSSLHKQDGQRGLLVDRGVGSSRLVKSASASSFTNNLNQDSEAKSSMPAAAGAVAAAAVADQMLGPKEDRHLAIVLVGLPARGKTFTAAKLTRYLRWLGHETKHFNVGKYRRLKHGANQPADFFRADNPQGMEARDEVAALAMEDMISWMQEGGQVGIFDATNSTRKRRNMLMKLAEGRCKIIFLETICNDRRIIERNIRLKIQQSPDYADQTNFEAGLEDFKTRLANYEKVYEPVEEGSYIKMIDMVAGQDGQVQVNHISGYLPGRIVFFLVNTHLTPRPILLTRHGESRDNVRGRIGGDTVLSDRGEIYSKKLANFVEKRLRSERAASIWTSTLQRTIITASPIVGFPKIQWRALDEINAGVCDGMTYEEIKKNMPEEYEARKKDKLRYRYPRGESYLDVIQRLEPVIIELERQRAPVVVISHQAVLRALYAYFADRPLKEIPHIEVPLHTIIEIQMGVTGVQEKRYKLMD